MEVAKPQCSKDRDRCLGYLEFTRSNCPMKAALGPASFDQTIEDCKCIVSVDGHQALASRGLDTISTLSSLQGEARSVATLC